MFCRKDANLSVVVAEHQKVDCEYPVLQCSKTGLYLPGHLERCWRRKNLNVLGKFKRDLPLSV